MGTIVLSNASGHVKDMRESNIFHDNNVEFLFLYDDHITSLSILRSACQAA